MLIVDFSQYISAMGKTGNLLLIDCRSHGYTLVPYGNGGESPIILVTNSNVKHELTGSEYPDRVAQCKSAVRILQSAFPEVKVRTARNTNYCCPTVFSRSARSFGFVLTALLVAVSVTRCIDRRCAMPHRRCWRR